MVLLVRFKGTPCSECSALLPTCNYLKCQLQVTYYSELQLLEFQAGIPKRNGVDLYILTEGEQRFSAVCPHSLRAAALVTCAV